MSDHHAERIGALVVAYNAAETLASVLDRLPPTFRRRVDRVQIADDASQDATYEIGREYEAFGDLPLTTMRQPRNLGYGGNQKVGYRWTIEAGLDVVVLLHADGQYAPEVIEDLVQPLLEGSARQGGMPVYKLLGNRILTRVENALTGLGLSEWHSGYRALSRRRACRHPVRELRRRFERMVDDVGLAMRWRAVVGSPIEVLERGGDVGFGRVASLVGAADRKAA